MTIIHQTKKTHQNVDNLSRLPSDPNLKINSFSNIIVANNDDLFTKIVKEFSNDKTLAKIINKLKKQIKNTKNDNDGPKTKYQSYKMNSNTDFLYFKNKSYSKRLCISKNNQRRLLQYAHDEHVHEDIHKTYNLLYKSVYISKMKKLIIQYVTTCSVCQLSKSSRQFSYEKLQFFEISTESLIELFLNFIVALSIILNGNNVIMSITNHYIKYVKTISGTETMSIEQGKNLYGKFVFKNGRISTKFINDGNFKFNSNFGVIVFKRCETSLNMTTAYHLSADDQAEKSNQTIETTLKFLLMSEYAKKGNEMLSQVEYALNVFENASTGISSFEILYDVKSKNSLLRIIRKNFSKEKIEFMKNKRQFKLNVINAIKMTQAKMAIQFDKKHRSSNFEKQIYLKMIKIEKSRYHLSKQNSLSTKKLESYFIVKKISSLIYELKLSDSLNNIHSIISVIHLKQYKKNFFQKKLFEIHNSNLIIINKQSQYVIKKIVRTKLRDDKPKYIIKGKKYKKIIGESKTKFQIDVSKLIRRFNDRRSRRRRGRGKKKENERTLTMHI